MLALYLPIILFAAVAGAFCLIAQPVVTLGRRGRSSLPADPGRLEHDVRTLSTQFVPRDEEHPLVLDSAARYIASIFHQFCENVEEQAFELGGNTYRNIIASFGPDTGERIVVGAHYDTDGPFPGADDNASGIAGLA